MAEKVALKLSEQWKKITFWVALPLGYLLLNYVVIPAFPDGEVAPPGIIMLGLYIGMLSALTAAGLILIYRAARFINFSQIALGALGVTLMVQLLDRVHVPWGLSLAAGLITGPLVAAILGIVVVTLLYRTPRLVLTVFSIIIAGQLVGLQFLLTTWFTPPGARPHPFDLRGPWPDKVWEVSGVPFRVGHLVGVILAVGAIGGLALFFRRTRLGIAIRGSAENSERASLLGINVRLLQIFVWSLAGLFSAMALTLATPVTGYQLGAVGDPSLLLIPLTAAVIGRMQNLPVTMATALGISLVNRTVQWSYGDAGFVDFGLFGVILIGLLLQRTKLQARQVETSSWRALKEVRPMPRELDVVAAVRWTRRVLFGLLGLTVLALPWILDQGQIDTMGQIYIFGIVFVSLLVLTGWAGQISFGQFAFVAIGAMVAGTMTATWHWPFWVAVPLATAVGAVFAVLVGIPALRIKGLFLAVATFALAVVTRLIFFSEKFLADSVPTDIKRPKLFFIKFDDNRSFYYLLLIAFVAVMLMTRAIRRSRTGRVLIATREDEAGAQSFGVDVRRARLSAFALSGALAAFAGALYAHQQLGMAAGDFDPALSFEVFVAGVVGGLGSLAGPVFAAGYYIGSQFLPGFWQGVVFSTIPIATVLFVPGGLAQIFFGMRDGILRVVAMRRHIIVPSLFADYSPEAWEKRLAPLSAPLPSRGLAALRPEQRYTLRSRLWGKTPEKVS